jgi:hypothetical protein
LQSVVFQAGERCHRAGHSIERRVMRARHRVWSESNSPGGSFMLDRNAAIDYALTRISAHG